jgi:diguanylate cyclase (GGDEF)-like protein
MPDATMESARERAELFRKQFEDMVNVYEGKQIQATFSAGIASFPTHSNSGEILLSMADTALYQSKADGRNRVTMFSPEMAHSIPEK